MSTGGGGYTDEVAQETHDMIHRAEEEERQAHPNNPLTQLDSGEGLGDSQNVGASKSGTTEQQPQQGQQGHHQSKLDKVKEALHLKK